MRETDWIGFYNLQALYFKLKSCYLKETVATEMGEGCVAG